MVVIKSFGVCLGSGRMAELDIRSFLRSLDHIVLVAEAVREYDAAALIRHIHGFFIALLSFRDVCLQNDLILGQPKQSGRILRSVDEVQVVSGILIMQEDESGLEIFRHRFRY